MSDELSRQSSGWVYENQLVLKASLLREKRYQTASRATEKHDRKSQLLGQPSLLPCFKKLPQSPQPAAKTTLMSAAINIKAKSHGQKEYSSRMAQRIVSNFQQESIF